jgi:hypothetical protein
MDTSARLSSLERWLIVLPLLGGLVFGLFPLLVPGLFATLTGFQPMMRTFLDSREPLPLVTP